MVSVHAERTFERLRYLLGGDRPSQTAHLTMSPDPIQGQQFVGNGVGICFKGDLRSGVHVKKAADGGQRVSTVSVWVFSVTTMKF